MVRCTARMKGDPDRYIRRVKGGRFQARPWDLGERFDLGIFATIGEARRAIREWRLGLRESLPRFVRLVAGRYLVSVYGVRVGDYDTRLEAAAAAKAYCVTTFGAAAAAMMLRRLA